MDQPYQNRAEEEDLRNDIEDDEARHSDGYEMHGQLKYVEELLHADSAYTGSNSFHRQGSGEHAEHSGDELTQQTPKLSASSGKNEKALSQCAQLESSEIMFQLQEKQRRVSDSGAALGFT